MLFLSPALLLAALAAAPRPGVDSAAGYRVVDTLKLGGDGGWDYLTVDS